MPCSKFMGFFINALVVKTLPSPTVIFCKDNNDDHCDNEDEDDDKLFCGMAEQRICVELISSRDHC